MSRKLPMQLCFAGLLYHFEAASQLTDWVDVNIAYSMDRRQLYEAIMCDSYQHVIQIAGSGTSDAEYDSIAILKSLKVISERYGPVYDPDKEIFKLEEDMYKKLDID